MKIPYKLFLFSISYLFIIFAPHQTIAQTSTPVLFFSDLTSGPNTGGKENLGAFITLYGEGFGTTQNNSNVAIGGLEVAKYVIWGENNAPVRDLDMIVIQPGPNIASGNIVITVNGRASNPLPFAVRSGEIYFVIPAALNANDTNPGTYTEPFQTLYRPRQSVQAGDIVYIKGGIFNTADPMYPGWDATLLLHPDTDANGTADLPIAYIGYPGDPPVLGGPQPMRRGIFVDQLMEYYIFANLRFTQYSGTLELSGNGHRVVGNSSYDGIFSNGGVIGILGNSAHYKIFGNLIQNNGESGDKTNGPGFYVQGFGINQDIDFGWNQVQDQHGSRAIQVFGHADGDRIDNLYIHDNLISGSELNNIVLGGSDGSNDVLGTVYVYNNIIVGSGTSGLRINDPQGTIFIQNNMLYNNGLQAIYDDEYAQLQIQRAGAGLITLQNNILYAEPGETYYWLEPGVDPSALQSSNNLWFNAGVAPGWDANSVNLDPMFMNILSGDFRLQAESPAIDVGINTGINRDYLGISRPQNAAYDIGAYEYAFASSVEIGDNQSSLRYDFRLQQNYPNPFNLTTTIRYTLPECSDVQLRVFTLLGQSVKELVRARESPGFYSVSFDASDLVSGVYLYRLEARGKINWSQTKKFIFLK